MDDILIREGGKYVFHFFFSRTDFQNNKLLEVENEGRNLNFTEVFSRLPKILGNNSVSIQTCFLTVLHLANENGLRLEEEESEFKIRRELC